jgi:4-amino-4-deoxy-L-arabinose transferase-like glycosyltransferase
MRVAEGARRMTRAGQWTFLIGITAFLSLFAISMMGNSPAPGLGESAQLALLGIALWVAAWIIEGFSEEAR